MRKKEKATNVSDLQAGRGEERIRNMELSSDSPHLACYLASLTDEGVRGMKRLRHPLEEEKDRGITQSL